MNQNESSMKISAKENLREVPLIFYAYYII